jgi:pimeloyl-ACP methyl ester carboxylesterase
VEKRRIAIGSAELSYLEVAGEGRPFVLLHGLTGHRDDFRTRLPDLADLGWLLAPDLRGHGDFSQIGREESFSFEQLVVDLNALLDAWGVESCDLLGHSFGGMLALRFVLAQPERVGSLILMDTAPFSPEDYARATFEKAGAIARARGMAFLQQLVEKAMRGNPDPSPSDRQTRKWGDLYWTHQKLRYGCMDPVGYGALGIAMVEQAPVVDRLAEIRCPTSVLVGAFDNEFLKGADALEAGIDGAVRVTIPDAGHHPQMENPEAWLAAVRRHFRRVRG